MGKNIYVGNLSYDTTQDQLQALFEAHGEVSSVNVITDRDTGRPRGFAFVEMDRAGGQRSHRGVERPGSGWPGVDGERGQAPCAAKWRPRSRRQSRWRSRQVVVPPR